MLSLDNEGFVRSFLCSCSVSPFESDKTNSNQLSLEAELRRDIVTEKKDTESFDIKVGDRWKPFYSYGSIFVDASSFYSTLRRIRMEVATTLICKEDIIVDAILWTYMASALYLDGKLIAKTDHPVYKPIQKLDIKLNLKKGRNDIVILSDNLGVRDTRNIAALQILSERSIETGIPDEEWEGEYVASASFLDGIREEKDGRLVFSSPAPKGTSLLLFEDTEAFGRKGKAERRDVSGLTSIDTEGYRYFSVLLENGFTRRFENNGAVKVIRHKGLGRAENYKRILERIASIAMIDRGTHGFASFSLLASRALGFHEKDEKALILNDIKIIEERFDCSDFLVCSLLRYRREYGFPSEIEKCFKSALLSYRYWMTMKGTDGMCFWSENHSLMFYFSAYEAGRIYPDDFFARTGMVGSELSLYGKRRVGLWLDDVLENGFEEFASSTYMCVTLAVLLNVVDYMDKEYSDKASRVLDKMLRALSLQAFHGTVISPMGRVYRDAVYPYKSGVQELMNVIDPSAPDAVGEGWLSFLATSSYRFPDDLLSLIERDASLSYTEGNAEINIEKNEDFILTSVSSPRSGNWKRWENTSKKAGVDAEDNHFIKSLNECFHGTTAFQPGVYGYQQQMWYAALSPDTAIFINHPGASSEESDMRPGYWNGNGVMPLLLQNGSLLRAIYIIPENHPIGFVHAYIPLDRFDEVVSEGNWLFMRKENGYIALWSSGKLERYDDWIAGAEMRIYGRASAFVIRCGRREKESFASFMESSVSLSPSFTCPTLSLSGFEDVEYKAVNDWTQALD